MRSAKLTRCVPDECRWQWVLTFTMVFGLVAGAPAQPGTEAPHPELKWYTIETEHFLVHFHEGAERSARVTAKVAEEVFPVITALYDYTPPEKINFVIRDHDDFSNGAAYYYDNKITIWASSLDFALRGSHNWLRNVVTHEFTHMIQLQAARKMSRKLPAFYLQSIGYEKETRPEDLYGFPNSIVSFPVPLTVIPSWFAEGVAQFQVPGLGYDAWDSHRDMLLRTAVLENKLLTLSEMSSFGKNSIGNERAYNQGFALVAYMARKYGLESLAKATAAMRAFLRFSFSGAIKQATGKSGAALYAEWKDDLQQSYAARVQTIREHLAEGELIESQGIGNFYPLWAKEGRRIAYLSSGSSDFLSRTALLIRNLDTGEVKVIRGGVQTAFDWSPDGRFLAYAKRTDPNRHLSYYYDLYLFDLQDNKEQRLTRDARAFSPAFSPDGRRLVCVVNADGTRNLALFDLAAGTLERVTRFQNGEQVFQPQWSPDGRHLVFALTEREGRRLCLLDLQTGELENLETGALDSRDARFSADGKSIYFSADHNGIFNIYRMYLQTGELQQLTNVLGGAFMPSVNEQGELVYACFKADGYKIALLPQPRPLPESDTRYRPPLRGIQVAATRNGFVPHVPAHIRAPAYDDRKLPNLEAKPYHNTYGALSFLPVLRRDYGTTKLGTYFTSSDVLNKYSIFGGLLVNRDLDYDLLAIIEYNNLGPRLFIEAYNQVLHSSEGSDKFRYNFAQVGAGIERSLPYRANHRLRAEFVYSRASAKIKTRVGSQPVSFGYTYYIGRSAQIRYAYDGVVPAVDMEANPRAGRRVSLLYSRDWNLFINGFEVNRNFGTLQEVYDRYYLHRIEADWREYFPLPARSSLMLRLYGGYIDRSVTSFFAFLGGGIFGNRGYPYFAISGRRMLHGTLAYRLPVLRNIDMALGPIHFDKLFLGLFIDATEAFDHQPDFTDLKKSAGVQLRLDTFSFYGFPSNFFFDAAYGFDRLQTENGIFGKTWRFYFGVTFGYFD